MAPVISLRGAIMILLTLLAMIPMRGQDAMDRDTTREILSLVEECSSAWERVELNGKLKSSYLPLSPSVKVYMENGTRLDLSVRAPFLGEVGRIQATTDTIVAVNKMKKVYWSASMNELSRKYPGGIELLQSLLLGRMVIFGQGVLGEDMGGMVSIYPDGEEGWLIMPRQEHQVSGARYGYVAGALGETLALIVERENNEDYLQVDYDWKKNGKYDLMAELAIGSKLIDATLQFDTPKWDAMPMSPIAVDRKYRRVEIKEFFGKMF